MHRWALLILFLGACRSPDIGSGSTAQGTSTTATATATAPDPPPSVSVAPNPKASADPNDPFAPYPGSQELCNRVVISDGKPLHWRSWVTGDDWVSVGGYYKARAKGMLANQATDRIEIHTGAGPSDRVLVVYPAAVASTKPQCNKPLAPADKTVIMVSEMKLPDRM